MPSRRSMIINKPFQVRIALRLSVVILLGSLAAICTAGYAVFAIATSATEEMGGLEDAITTEENIFKAFLVYSTSADGNRLKLSVKDIMADDLTPKDVPSIEGKTLA